MKKKIIYSVVLLFLTVAFISKIPTAEEKSITYTQLQPGTLNPDNEFIIGAMHNAYDQKNNYSNIKDTFHMNTWHKYTAPIGWGWYLPGTSTIDTNDNWNGDTNDYGPNVRQSIYNNNAKDFRTIMDRPVIQYFAYGQRSDYQCEELNTSHPLWFYSYNEHLTGRDIADNSQYGNGDTVRYCEVDPHQTDGGANWVVKSLKANHEQANKRFNPWASDSMYAWYIKPRIRVDPNFVQNYPNNKVCRIDIIDWHGSTLRQVEILGINFRDGQGNYNGRYLDEFYFSHTNNEGALKIDTGWHLCPWPDSGRSFGNWDVPIKTDYQVYWYGNCDMWIDYVRVENEPSVQLHSELLDWKIESEVDWAYDPSNPIPNIFYVDEFEFNHIPSIKRVNEIIKQRSLNKLSLSVDFEYNLFKIHLPDAWGRNLNADFIKQYLIDSADIGYLLFFCYPLEGWSKGDSLPDRISYHPNTLYSGDYSFNDTILSYRDSPEDYDEWLQRHLEKETGAVKYGYILKLCDSLSKISNNLRLINVSQAHLWWASGHKLKEPTREEAELMANLAISYGSKGMIYFSYNSHHNTQNGSFSRGLIQIDGSLRNKNVYGQFKYTKYAEMNEKYNKWAPYLMSFDDENRHSYIFRDNDEREALFQNTYFLGVKTFKPGSGHPICQAPDDTAGNGPPPQQSLTYDCPEDTYLQVALFDDDIVDYDKYFMIVNRRCSPYLYGTSADSNGGRRFVRILFDANDSISFPNYDNWDIIDLEKDTTIFTFDKTKVVNIDLGWYLPGEGKLYKIAPVIK